MIIIMHLSIFIIRTSKYIYFWIVFIDDKVLAAFSNNKLLRMKQIYGFTHRLRNYTCADETMETSTPIKSYQKVLQGQRYQVDVLLDAPNSKIWLVDDFITPGDSY